MPSQYSKTIRITFWLMLTASYIAAILPQDVAPTMGDLSDKTLHFLAFGLLTLLLMLSYRLKWWQGALYMLTYGVFIELTQAFTPTRCSEGLDVVADGIGIAIGLVLYAGYKKLEAICADS
ncbi:MAG: VanZ family protein [Sulfurovum sp.]|nr:VanZ family protein [Sulfurovum sp.]